MVKSTLRIFAFSSIGMCLVVGALGLYSYQRLLAFERRFMPTLTTLATRHERRVSFQVLPRSKTRWVPQWTVTYFEDPVTDTEYVDPSLSIDLFGRISDAASKEVSGAVDDYKKGRE